VHLGSSPEAFSSFSPIFFLSPVGVRPKSDSHETSNRMCLRG
jgi:hypothetical protein